MIIGLTGSFCAGKDTVAEILIDKGFEHFSLSDIIREHLDICRMEKSRETLQDVGNKLREKHGPSVLADMTLRKLVDKSKNYVVTSIRNPGEVEKLRERKNFVMVFVTAPLKSRWNRMQKRKRKGDANSFDQFKKQEQKEKSSDPTKQNLTACEKMADIVLNNGGTMEQLNEKLVKLLKDVETKYRKNARMSIDEYFLKIAMVVAERSTCRRHNIGAVIVKNKHILTTGYNGAAAGIKDCLEQGCLKDTKGHGSGKGFQDCRAVHAEENAIVQAGKHNQNTEGATLYCTHNPCNHCSKLIINAGIKRVVSFGDYADKTYVSLFDEAGVKFERMKMPSKNIEWLP
ncbi:deaminase [Nanoarchaeota archaeon]